MTVTVRKWGNSLAVRIPKAVVIGGRLREGQPVEVSLRDGEVVMAAVPPRLTLEGLLAGVTPRNLHREIDSGAPLGREAW